MEKKLNQISNFNERFKEAFGERSVTDFAEEVGLAKQTISAYLNGVRKPKRPTTKVIAEKLGVSPCWLCGYDVPMHSDVSIIDEKAKLVKELTDSLSDLTLDEMKQVIDYTKYLRSKLADK